MKRRIIISHTLAETTYAVQTQPAELSLKRLMGGLTILAVVMSLIAVVAVPARAVENAKTGNAKAENAKAENAAGRLASKQAGHAGYMAAPR